MTEEQLFAETGSAYLSLIHLEDDVEEAIAKISACVGKSSNQFIDALHPAPPGDCE